MTHQYDYIIIDDEPKAIKMLHNTIDRLCDNLKMSGSYTDWESALDALNNHDIDIAFLDISMPHKSGFKLLEMVPELSCEVIFVTAHEEYALNGYKFSPADYLLKPVDDERLLWAVNKAIKHIDNKSAHADIAYTGNNKEDKLGIRNNNGLDYVALNDIIFFEASTRYTHVITKDKKYVSTSNLGKFKAVLDDRMFYNVHRSFIINVNHVIRYESSGILILTSGHQIPVAKNTRDKFLKLFSRC